MAIFTTTPRMMTPIIKKTDLASNFVPEPSMFEHWLKSKKSVHPSPLPQRPKYKGIQRIFEIAHKSVIYTCIGVSLLIVGQLGLWMATGEGRRHREDAISLALKKHKESQPDTNNQH